MPRPIGPRMRRRGYGPGYEPCHGEIMDKLEEMEELIRELAEKR